MRRRAAKVDENQGRIVEALRAAGVTVIDLSAVGDGVPDLMCFRPATGLLRLLEVKAKKGRLTPAQEEFSRVIPVWVVRTVPEALRAMEIETTGDWK